MGNKVYIAKIALPGHDEGARFIKMDNNSLPDNLPKDGIYYYPEGHSYPIYEEKDLISSPYFREESEPPTLEEIKYIADKRNFALEKFVLDVKADASPDAIQDRFNLVMKLTKRLRDIEDALMTYTLTKKIEEYNKKFGI